MGFSGVGCGLGFRGLGLLGLVGSGASERKVLGGGLWAEDVGDLSLSLPPPVAWNHTGFKSKVESLVM